MSLPLHLVLPQPGQSLHLPTQHEADHDDAEAVSENEAHGEVGPGDGREGHLSIFCQDWLTRRQRRDSETRPPSLSGVMFVRMYVCTCRHTYIQCARCHGLALSVSGLLLSCLSGASFPTAELVSPDVAQTLASACLCICPALLQQAFAPAERM